VYNVLETTGHIFFHWPLAKFVWASLREALGWDSSPLGLRDFLDNRMLMAHGLWKLQLQALLFRYNALITLDYTKSNVNWGGVYTLTVTGGAKCWPTGAAPPLLCDNQWGRRYVMSKPLIKQKKYSTPVNAWGLFFSQTHKWKLIMEN
jgi:hypothetical protein